MARTVITQKGERLNFDELIMKARRPLKPTGDQKDTIKQTRRPPMQPNIRGFMPSASGVKSKVSVPVPEPVDSPSLADFTGVTIADPRHLKEKPSDTMAVANDALKDIMTDLESLSGKPKKVRRA